MDFTKYEFRLARGRFSKSAILLLSSLLALGTVACGSDDADNSGQGGQGGQIDPGPDAGDVDPSLTRIEVTPALASVVERRTVQLTAKAFDQEDAELDIAIGWASSDENLATVDATGLVTSLRPGEVKITASAGGKSAEATITVTASTVASVEIEADSMDVGLDAHVSIVAVAKDAEGYELLGRAIDFTSEDESIAKVDATGTVTGIDIGATKIKAKLEGFEDSIDVRVVHRFVDIFAGSDHTCGLTAAGRAWCWGANGDGQLGNAYQGEEGGETQAVPVRVVIDESVSFQTLALGEETTCGLTKSKEVWCWGTNDNLVLGRSEDDVTWSAVPLLLDDRSYETIGSMAYGVCGLDASGFAHCWGYGSDDYELGDPDVTDNSMTPVAVSAPEGENNPVAFTVLRHGRYFSCGLTAAGRLYCWGFNSSGQLGDGTTNSRAHAISPLGDTVVKSFGLGIRFACATTEDDVTHCWGENDYGQVDPSAGTADVRTPVVRFPSNGFVPASFALGNEHGCALDDEGRAFCWGRNSYSQLGRETAEEAADIGEVDGDLRFTKLVSGEYHVCGLAKDGKTYCWGDNWSGQLGSGDVSEAGAPTPVVGQ